MNITKKQIDDLNLEVVLKIEAADYAENVKKKLCDIRRRAELKGFRKGMAPASLINRLYGDQVLYESVNAEINKGLGDFINENKLHVVGEPLPSEDQPKIKWVAGNDFEFKFNIATTPEVNFTLGKEDKIPYYQINVTKDAMAGMKKNLLSQYGSMQEAGASGENDYIVADLDNGTHKVDGAYISLRSVAEGCRDSFLARKAGDEFTIDVNAAFENETDRAAMLKVAKDKLAEISPSIINPIVPFLVSLLPAPLEARIWKKLKPRLERQG